MVPDEERDGGRREVVERCAVLATVIPLRGPIEGAEDEEARELHVAAQAPLRMQRLQHWNPGGFVFALQRRDARALPRRDRAGLIEHDGAQERSYLAEGFDIESLVKNESAFGRNIWGLLNLELWQQTFIDNHKFIL